MLALYARAVASGLPLVGSRGGDTLPSLRLAHEGLEADRERLAAYDRVCGFRLRDELPSTYVHVLAFPSALRLLTDRTFPLPALGLVHVRNVIVQRRALRLGEAFDLVVRAERLAPHERGRTVDVVAEARVEGELVWEDVSTYLHRSGGGGGGGRTARALAELPPAAAVWEVPGDVGRRYAAVSGDANPIHMHRLAAKLFGLRRAIAHGMWLKARCLAALEHTLPAAYTVDVAFKLPVELPSSVTFSTSPDGAFAVHAARDGKPHLTGAIAAG